VPRIVLDEAALAKLRIAEAAEILDCVGRTVGQFLSEEVYRRFVYDRVNSRITDDEVQRRLLEPGRSLGAILSGLEQH
jgi:hypothetical protein